MSGIKILKSSPFTTLQDSGRRGFQFIGITTSGAADEYAYNYANKILSNSYGTNALEILWGGLKIQSYVNSYFVITGANFNATLNGKKIENWQSYKIKYGDVLEFFAKTSGQIAYLCFKDGFKVKKELASVSSCIKDEIGGLNSEVFIKKGDFLKCKEFNSFQKRVLASKYIPIYKDELTLRVIESYQNDFFSSIEKEKFYNTTYTISKEFNKMGCKLKGEKIEAKKSDIISEGIAFGSIQIPKDGEPIILLKERQTIGGYPKFGVVIAIDCFKLAQMATNGKVKFEKIELKEAQKKLKKLTSLFIN